MIDGRASAPLDCTQNNRSVLCRIGQEYAERLRAPITKETAIVGSSSWDEYELVGSRRGHVPRSPRQPNGFLSALVHEWEDGQGARARIDVDHKGSLWAFSRGFPQGIGIEKLSAEEARPLAESAIQGFSSAIRPV